GPAQIRLGVRAPVHDPGYGIGAAGGRTWHRARRPERGRHRRSDQRGRGDGDDTDRAGPAAAEKTREVRTRQSQSRSQAPPAARGAAGRGWAPARLTLDFEALQRAEMKQLLRLQTARRQPLRVMVMQKGVEGFAVRLDA